jgi:MSHA biogenesis protein MshM
MYYAHFGLKQPPFKITPNTDFFFSGGNRGAVLDALIYAITSGEGIIKVVGEVGSGKTMLCRMLQTLLPEKVESVYLANPSVAPEDVLHAIAFELQLKLPKNADRLQVMQVLQKYLLDRHEQGKQVVIFVEEAQGMPIATLEEIRLLSNLETKHDKLLQIVLFGQPELDVNLNQTQIRQLRERITHGFNLGPLEEKDVGEYLIFRLRTAGYFGPHLFNRSAIRRLYKASEGLVRRVNILADKALLAAFAENVYQVTPKHMKAAIADSEFGAEQLKRKNNLHIYYAAAGIVLVGLSAGFLVHRYWPAGQAEPPVASASDKPAAAIIHDAPAPEADASVMPPATSLESAPVPATGVSPLPTVAPPASAPAPATVQSTTIPVAPAEADDILTRRLVATKNWLNQKPASTVTIQLMGGNSDEHMKNQLETLSQQVLLDEVYVFRTQVRGKPFMSVMYGSYASREEALQATQKLPRWLRTNRPQLRTVGGIIEETKQFQ